MKSEGVYVHVLSLVCQIYDKVEYWREFTEGQGFEDLKTD